MKKVLEHYGLLLLIFAVSLVFTSCSTETTGSETSGDAEGTNLTVPADFTGTYNAYTNEAVFTWNAVSGATGYKIYRNTTDDFSTAILEAGNATANGGFSLYGFSDEVVTYYFWITAFNSSAQSTHSSSVIITTSVVSPRNLRITASDGLSFSIAWDAVAGITDYIVYGSKTEDPSTAEKTGSINTNNATITLNAAECAYGTPVYMWVVAEKGSVVSTFGSPVIYTPAAPSVSTPVVTLVGNGSSATLTWSAISNVTGYKVYTGTTSDSAQAILSETLTGDITTATVYAANPGIKYYVWVTAYLTQNDSTYESPFSDALTFYQPLSATEMITTTGIKTENSIDISWLAVTGASKYEVYYGTVNDSSAAEKFPDTTTNLSLTVTGLGAGTTYYFWVRAVDAYDDEGVFSDSTQSKTKISIPQNVTLSSIDDTCVVLSWSASVGATSYTVAYGTSDDISDALKINDCTGLMKQITALTAGTRYNFWVNAVDSTTSYETAYSVSISGTTLPSRPVGLTITSYTTETVTLCWTAIPDAVTYRVCYNTTNTSSSSVKFGTTAGTTITVTGLSGGTTYYFWVQAYYNGTWSSLSDPVYQNTSGSGTKNWVSGSVLAYGTKYFTFSVTANRTYTVYWDDSYNGSGVYTCDVKVSAYMGSTNYFINQDSGYTTGQSFTPSTSGTVYIKVQPWSSGSGTFAVAVTQGTLNIPLLTSIRLPLQATPE